MQEVVKEQYLAQKNVGEGLSRVKKARLIPTTLTITATLMTPIVKILMMLLGECPNPSASVLQQRMKKIPKSASEAIIFELQLGVKIA